MPFGHSEIIAEDSNWDARDYADKKLVTILLQSRTMVGGEDGALKLDVMFKDPDFRLLGG